MTSLTRERNFDLIRSILLVIESSPPDSTITNSQLNIEGHDPSIVGFHVEMLKNAGFIDAVIEKNFSGSAFMIKGINWEGYEFLDNAKNDTIWKKFKAQAESKGSSMSMTVANGLLTALGKKYFGLD